jgi:transcriptional regulator with XRE-family HTH domain
MRTSLKRHVLAILRQDFLKMKQPEFARLLDCSLALVQSVESARAPLSLDLAERVELETGVSFDWLAKNDTKASPVNLDGQRYSREDFEKAQKRKGGPSPEHVNRSVIRAFAHAATILAAAYELDCFRITELKLNAALSDISSKLKWPRSAAEIFNAQAECKGTAKHLNVSPIAKAYLRAITKPTRPASR